MGYAHNLPKKVVLSTIFTIYNLSMTCSSRDFIQGIDFDLAMILLNWQIMTKRLRGFYFPARQSLEISPLISVMQKLWNAWTSACCDGAMGYSTGIFLVMVWVVSILYTSASCFHENECIFNLLFVVQMITFVHLSLVDVTTSITLLIWLTRIHRPHLFDASTLEWVLTASTQLLGWENISGSSLEVKWMKLLYKTPGL